MRSEQSFPPNRIAAPLSSAGGYPSSQTIQQKRLALFRARRYQDAPDRKWTIGSSLRSRGNTCTGSRGAPKRRRYTSRVHEIPERALAANLKRQSDRADQQGDQLGAGTATAVGGRNRYGSVGSTTGGGKRTPVSPWRDFPSPPTICATASSTGRSNETGSATPPGN